MRPARLLALLALAAAAGPASAQRVEVVGGSVEIVVPFDGVAFGTGVDASAGLRWEGRQGDRFKITVVSAVRGQSYDLRVTAVNTRFGKATGPVALEAGMLPHDVVTNINAGNWRNRTGEATLRYEATASAEAGAGADHHSVVYTLTQQ